MLNKLVQITEAILLSFLWSVLDWEMVYVYLIVFIPMYLIPSFYAFFIFSQILFAIFTFLSLYKAIIDNNLPYIPNHEVKPWYLIIHVLHSIYNTIKAYRGPMAIAVIGNMLHVYIGKTLYYLAFIPSFIAQLRISVTRSKKGAFNWDIKAQHILFSLMRISVSVIQIYTMFCIAFGYPSTLISLIIISSLILLGSMTLAIKTDNDNESEFFPKSKTEYLVYVLLIFASLTNTLCNSMSLMLGFFNISIIAQTASYLAMRSKYLLFCVKSFIFFGLSVSLHQQNYKYTSQGAQNFSSYINNLLYEEKNNQNYAPNFLNNSQQL